MRSLILILIIGGIAGFGALTLLNQSTHDRELASLEAKLSEQRSKFRAQLPSLLQVRGDAVQSNRSQMMAWHKNKIEEAFAQFPDVRGEFDYLTRVEDWLGEGRIDEEQAGKRRSRYQWLRGLWDNTLNDGVYKPVFTKSDGAIRLDILSMTPVPPTGNVGKTLKMDFAVWGAAADQLVFSGIELMVLREAEVKPGKTIKIVEQVTNPNAPNVFHPATPNPEPMEWIAEWPPGLGAGYYLNIPAFAKDATHYTLRFNLKSRTHAGTSVGGQMEWANLKVPASWKKDSAPEVKATMRTADKEDLEAAGFTKSK